MRHDPYNIISCVCWDIISYAYMVASGCNLNNPSLSLSPSQAAESLFHSPSSVLDSSSSSFCHRDPAKLPDSHLLPLQRFRAHHHRDRLLANELLHNFRDHGSVSSVEENNSRDASCSDHDSEEESLRSKSSVAAAAAAPSASDLEDTRTSSFLASDHSSTSFRSTITTTAHHHFDSKNSADDSLLRCRCKTCWRSHSNSSAASAAEITRAYSVGSRGSREREADFCSRNGKEQQDPDTTIETMLLLQGAKRREEEELLLQTDAGFLRRNVSAKNNIGEDDDDDEREAYIVRSSLSANTATSPWMYATQEGYLVRDAEERDGYRSYRFCVNNKVLFCRMRKKRDDGDDWVCSFWYLKTVKEGSIEREMWGMLGKMRVYEKEMDEEEVHFLLYCKRKRHGTSASVSHSWSNNIQSSSSSAALLQQMKKKKKKKRVELAAIVVSSSLQEETWCKAKHIVASSSLQEETWSKAKHIVFSSSLQEETLCKAKHIVVSSSLQEETWSKAKHIVVSSSLQEETWCKAKQGLGWGIKFLQKRSAAAATKGMGWGMRFLDRVSSSRFELEEEEAEITCMSKPCHHRSHTPLPSEQQEKLHHHQRSHSPLPSEQQEKIHLTHSSSPTKNRNQKHLAQVAVILPAGDHGLPLLPQNGPTPLLERWKSGGSCDCGGWDMGCGMSILKSHLPPTSALNKPASLHISMQGFKQRTLFTLQSIDAGHFSLSFQSPFSPLQAFATAIAILHQQQTS